MRLSAGEHFIDDSYCLSKLSSAAKNNIFKPVKYFRIFYNVLTLYT